MQFVWFNFLLVLFTLFCIFMQWNSSVHSDWSQTVVNPTVHSLFDHHVWVVTLGRPGRGFDHAGAPVVVDLLALPHHALAGAVAGLAGAVVPTPHPAALVTSRLSPCLSWLSRLVSWLMGSRCWLRVCSCLLSVPLMTPGWTEVSSSVVKALLSGQTFLHLWWVRRVLALRTGRTVLWLLEVAVRSSTPSSTSSSSSSAMLLLLLDLEIVN